MKSEVTQIDTYPAQPRLSGLSASFAKVAQLEAQKAALETEKTAALMMVHETAAATSTEKSENVASLTDSVASLTSRLGVFSALTAKAERNERDEQVKLLEVQQKSMEALSKATSNNI